MNLLEVLSIGIDVLNDEHVQSMLRLLGTIYRLTNEVALESLFPYSMIVDKDILPLYRAIVSYHTPLTIINDKYLTDDILNILIYVIMRAKFRETEWSIYIDTDPWALCITDGIRRASASEPAPCKRKVVCVEDLMLNAFSISDIEEVTKPNNLDIETLLEGDTILEIYKSKLNDWSTVVLLHRISSRKEEITIRNILSQTLNKGMKKKVPFEYDIDFIFH
jgi:hypothetical protein